ncbi:hypothetical protein HDE77_000793 [Rhodanobacter sp. MP7CTX1]|jgi:hypothetical protein|nr:hypothetical protein [Rhodanobacter sp. MP7CTX1]
MAQHIQHRSRSWNIDVAAMAGFFTGDQLSRDIA